MGLGDTQYMLNLVTLVTNEIAEDEGCFARLWPLYARTESATRPITQ
jgi:hypothetical protein